MGSDLLYKLTVTIFCIYVNYKQIKVAVSKLKHMKNVVLLTHTPVI